MKRILFIISLILPSFTVFCQVNEFLFNHFNTNDGLSHNTVYAINQDSADFIWIGTRSGLNRFDGSGFKTYGADQGLKDIFINTIFRDSEERIWIGTREGGISRYDYNTDSYETWMFSGSNESLFRNDNILAISEDNTGRIWAGSHAGDLFILSETPGEFIKIEFPQEMPGSSVPERIYAIDFDEDGNILIGSLNGLFNLRPKADGDRVSGILERKLNLWITCILRNKDNGIWLGTNVGLVYLTDLNSTPEIYNTSNSAISGNMITDLEFMGSGALLVSTDGGGLNVMDTTSKTFKIYNSDPNNPYSLSNNSVLEFFVDRDHSIWIGNWAGGVNYYSPDHWKFNLIRHKLNDPNSLSDNHVRTFFEDSRGEIWIGTLGGLNRYDRQKGAFEVYQSQKNSEYSLSSNTILSIFEPDPGELWIGTFGGGLNIFERESKSFRKYRHPEDLNNSLEHASIYHIIDLGENGIMLATLGGFYIIDIMGGNLQRFTASNSDLSNNTIKALCRDGYGNVWLGTNYGLNRFNPEDGSFRIYLHSNTESNSLSNNRILSILESSDANIWIGTEGGGISILNPQTNSFSTINTIDGLPDNVINSIIEDPGGAFWITTNKGLVRYEKGSGLMGIYTVADGLQGNEFYQNSGLLASDGTLYFGGPYGFNSFNSEKIRLSSKHPEVILTDLYVSGHIVREFGEKSLLKSPLFLSEILKFPYHSNFEIHFSVPGKPNLNKYSFSYILEGFNEEWSEFQKVNYANFANLRPGKYTFRVKALNNDGIISEKPAQIAIRILPPWWKTWWVFIVYAIILSALLFILLYLNNSKLNARHELQIELKEKQQAEAVNQLKLRFFTDISHEFKTPLTLILGNLDNIKTNTRRQDLKTFSIIESNAKRLLSLINQLLEFRKAETGLMKLQSSKANIIPLVRSVKKSFSQLATSKNIQFELDITGSIPELWFDKEKMEKILYNLLSNAFKYTPEGGSVSLLLSIENTSPVQPGFRAPKGYLKIVIRDSGIGIPGEEQGMIFERFYHGSRRKQEHHGIEGSGIGLAYTRRLVELHHGTIQVASEPEKGADFIVHLPLGKDHLQDDEIKGDNDYHLKLDYPEYSYETEPAETIQVPNSGTDKTKPLIMVVDDNPSLRQVITEKFQENYNVIAASDGKIGFERARHFLPDLIISDVMMPGIDGIQLCRLIKTNMITSHIPVILLTVKNEEEDKILGFNTGADSYISKPYNPEILKATVENLLNSRRILRKKYSAQSSNVPSELIGNRLDEEFLNKLVSIIEDEKHIDNLDVATLCGELAMSRSALYRKIKMLTDNSIQEFIRLVKLRKAARLLLSSRMPIAEIAYISGFTNSKHFSTAFKKLYVKTPSVYRASADV